MSKIDISETEVRSQMMELWKSTFHDSDEYINLVFDTYFDPDWVEYEVKDGKIIAALLGIPYAFGLNDNNENYSTLNKLRGLYLCGLSTKPEYRRMGLMSKLIEKVNYKAYKNNIAFTFLIPANDGLSKYYKDREYVPACFKYEYRYVNGFDFIKLCNNPNGYNIFEITNLNNDYKSILKYINSATYDNLSLNIIRNDRDIKAVIYENILSHGKILYAKDSTDKVVGILFASRNSNYECRVQELIYNNEDIKYLLLDKLQNKLNDNDVNLSTDKLNLIKEIIVNTAVPDKQKQIYSPYVDEYSYEFSEGEIKSHNEEYVPCDAQKMFAMARICKLSEILKFAAVLCPGREYSILVKRDIFPENRGLHEVNNGIYSYTPIDEFSDDELSKLERENSLKLDGFSLSVKGVAEFLWRHSADRVVDDIIAIPNLPLNVSLMLE